MPLPANLPENSFTLRRARSLGLRRSRLRAKDLLIPSRDIRLRRDAEPVLAERCRPYLDLLPDAFLSHVTAARLYGLPLPRPLQSEPTCVEYDGAHHLTPAQQSRDHHRDLLTHQLGWHQVRINKFDVAQGPAWVVGKVRQALVRGGWTP
ncbi:hypothetical protein H9638_04390 [Arthrobacter sp. Sa2BUA2]|uniref:DUF559 domain-containing protein n=1 Tax=Arthrobacter pullicola TaxID=2762224 RepID=A0ABR8YG03_9MICC|nr:hypothetical protein [Arthrobacter pullicola]MBD8043046.1 hypothetical protein [Arthrobacter pullicola]